MAIIALAAGSHLAVTLIRYLGRRGSQRAHGRTGAKWRSLASLSTSILVFVIYAWAIGLILRELGVSLTAYLAGASVIGLAVAFGSQGIVQDVLTGLTLVFSDLVDVGDMVKISGQTGIVSAITMRFVALENPLGAKVFIPNHTVTNVTNQVEQHLHHPLEVAIQPEFRLMCPSMMFKFPIYSEGITLPYGTSSEVYPDSPVRNGTLISLLPRCVTSYTPPQSSHRLH